jgi:hypothetical protein
MIFLRRVTHLLLILVILPWGAFSPAHAAQFAAPISAYQGFMPQESLTVTAIGSRAHMAQLLSSPKQCRTMSLLGAACGPDVAITPNTSLEGPDAQRPVFPHFEVVYMHSAVVSLAFDPPRYN